MGNLSDLTKVTEPALKPCVLSPGFFHTIQDSPLRILTERLETAVEVVVAVM